MKANLIFILIIGLIACSKKEGKDFTLKSDAEYIAKCRELVSKESDFVSFIEAEKTSVGLTVNGVTGVGLVTYVSNATPNLKNCWASCIFHATQEPYVAFWGNYVSEVDTQNTNTLSCGLRR